MKTVFAIIVLVLLSFGSQAQTLEIDSSVTSKYKIVKVSPSSEIPSEPANNEDKGFGDLVMSLGEGFIKRLKYRFNLEGVEEKVNKFKKKPTDEDSGG